MSTSSAIFSLSNRMRGERDRTHLMIEGREIVLMNLPDRPRLDERGGREIELALIEDHSLRLKNKEGERGGKRREMI